MIDDSPSAQQQSQPPPKAPEKSCPLWQKPCSQANHDCVFWIDVEVLAPGPLAGTTKKMKDSLCLLFAIFHAANAPKIAMGGPGGPTISRS